MVPQQCGSRLKLVDHSQRQQPQSRVEKFEIEMRSVRDYVKSMLITMNVVFVCFDRCGATSKYNVHTHATIKLSVTAWKDRQMYHLINLKFTSQLNFRGAAAAAAFFGFRRSFNTEHFLMSTRIQGERNAYETFHITINKSVCSMQQVTETVYQCIKKRCNVYILTYVSRTNIIYQPNETKWTTSFDDFRPKMMKMS